MKECLRCGQTYTDGDINFCLNDGELLSRITGASEGSADDPPPTILMDQPRRTSELEWQSAQPPAPYQSPLPSAATPAGQMIQLNRTPDQMLAIASLCLGIASLTIGWCCYSGFLLGPAAIITGIIGLVAIKNDPKAYGGRGFAIGGIVAGSVYFLLFLLLVIFYAALLAIPN